MVKEAEPLIVDLVMSTLNISSTGVSFSGRPIIPLTTPSYLPARLVLDTWIKEYIPTISFSSAQSELKLLSLISCLSPLPRAIQLMVEVMQGKSVSPISMDANSIRILYLNTVNKVKLWYPKLKNVELRPKYGKALLFGEELLLDDNVMNLIVTGVFTNSVDDIFPEATIIPQTSIIAMDVLSRDKLFYSKEIRQMVDCMLAFLDDSIQQKENSGRPLEIVFNRLITARLSVLLDLFEETRTMQKFTLFSLFQQQQFQALDGCMSNKLFDILRNSSTFIVSGTRFETMQLTSSCSKWFVTNMVIALPTCL